MRPLATDRFGVFLRRRAEGGQFRYTSRMGLIPDEVRVVYFDAVGTLLFPDPPVAEAYHAAGRRYGSRLTLEEVGRGFSAAFAAQEQVDATVGYRTSEERERQRWAAIVAEVLPDVSETQACFTDLYRHFGRPQSWRLADRALDIFIGLNRSGREVGLASNFDHRLLLIVKGKRPLMDEVGRVVISSGLGWRKPAPEFFAALCDGYRPNQVLLVGDDRVNDYDGARAAGLHAVLLDDTTTLTDLLS